jgi:hypothetical protein
MLHKKYKPTSNSERHELLHLVVTVMNNRRFGNFKSASLFVIYFI